MATGNAVRLLINVELVPGGAFRGLLTVAWVSAMGQTFH
ncbi:hypothetical protein THIOSC13_280001 [uncultured Thiomicrorhabdus sp.]